MLVGHVVARNALLLLVLPLALLSGCAGAGSSASSGAQVGDATGTGGAHAMMMGGMATLSYAIPRSIATTVWANGSFDLTEGCNTNPMRTCVPHPTDITAQLVEGVPVDIQMDVTYTNGPFTFYIQPYIQSEKSTWLMQADRNDPGHYTSHVLLVPHGTVQAVVIDGGPTSTATTSPYTFSISLASSNSTTPAGVPVMAHLHGNATFEAKTPSGADARYLLWGPDDALVGNFTGRYTLPVTAKAGSYVALVLHADEPVIFRSDSGDRKLATVGLKFEASPTETVAPNGGYSKSFTPTGAPAGVGVALQSAQTPVGSGPLVSGSVTVTLTAPDGTVLHTMADCSPFCLAISFSAFWGTSLGDPHVGAGSYKVTVDTQAAYQASITTWFVYFDRPA